MTGHEQRVVKRTIFSPTGHNINCLQVICVYRKWENDPIMFTIKILECVISSGGHNFKYKQISELSYPKSCMQALLITLAKNALNKLKLSENIAYETKTSCQKRNNNSTTVLSIPQM